MSQKYKYGRKSGAGEWYLERHEWFFFGGHKSTKKNVSVGGWGQKFGPEKKSKYWWQVRMATKD